MVKDIETCSTTDASTHLFVAHNQKLCNNADRIFKREARPGMVLDNCKPAFKCLVDVLPLIERHFQTEFLQQRGRTEQTKVDFKMFKSRFWPQIISKLVNCQISARLVWAKVQSVIKGSIEVVQERDQSYLHKSQYLSLGKKHDRLTQEVRCITMWLCADLCTLIGPRGGVRCI